MNVVVATNRCRGFGVPVCVQLLGRIPANTIADKSAESIASSLGWRIWGIGRGCSLVEKTQRVRRVELGGHGDGCRRSSGYVAEVTSPGLTGERVKECVFSSTRFTDVSRVGFPRGG